MISLEVLSSKNNWSGLPLADRGGLIENFGERNVVERSDSFENIQDQR